MGPRVCGSLHSPRVPVAHLERLRCGNLRLARPMHLAHWVDDMVALVARDEARALVRYLGEVGFAVRAYATPDAAHGVQTLIWVTDPGSGDLATARAVRAWLGASLRARAIVVSAQPTSLRAAIDDGRVWLLPAPASGRELADALRDMEPR
jgi:hypothetical protein